MWTSNSLTQLPETACTSECPKKVEKVCSRRAGTNLNTDENFQVAPFGRFPGVRLGYGHQKAAAGRSEMREKWAGTNSESRSQIEDLLPDSNSRGGSCTPTTDSSLALVVAKWGENGPARI